MPDALNAFGMVMPERSFSNEKYRYGFNGKENDNEVKGVGNSVDFGARIYDSRLGRFLSVDPLIATFPFQSSYCFAGNAPVKFIDKDGTFQLDPGIQKSYPIIYKYLSNQIAKDVLNSTTIKSAFQTVNQKVNDAYLSYMFTNNSGPVLYDTNAPNGEQNAAGHTNYHKDGSSIEINTKIFSYVEGVLRNDDFNSDDKQAALLLLYSVVLHEAGHEATGFIGMKSDGKPEMKSTNNHETLEPGYSIEGDVWGLPGNQLEKSHLPNVIQDLDPGNTKNKEGVMENIVTDAKKENKSDVLPTLPKE